MLAYNNDPALKDAICAEIKRHQDQDMIMTGDYWNGEKGCAVGCSLRSYSRATNIKLAYFGNHKIYDDFLGNGGEALAHLEDTLFENLPRPGHLKFPLRVAMAIRPGADISGVCHRFTAWGLTNPDLFPGCVDPAVKPVIDAVAALFLRVASGDMPSAKQWAAAMAERAAMAAMAERAAAGAARAAMAAAGAAARAAMAERAARAASRAARAAMAAAGVAARAAMAERAARAARAAMAERAAAGAAAADGSCVAMANKLIELLEAA